MAGPLLKTCCFCQSTRNGSIVSGLLAIILSIITIIVIFTTRVAFKTIFFDIDTDIVKIILAVNLCMTILISTLMIAGVIKVSNKTQVSLLTNVFTFTNVCTFLAQPLSNDALGGIGHNDRNWPIGIRHLYSGCLLH